MSMEFYIHLINRCYPYMLIQENDYIIITDSFYLLEE